MPVRGDFIYVETGRKTKEKRMGLKKRTCRKCKQLLNRSYKETRSCNFRRDFCASCLAFIASRYSMFILPMLSEEEMLLKELHDVRLAALIKNRLPIKG